MIVKFFLSIFFFFSCAKDDEKYFRVEIERFSSLLEETLINFISFIYIERVSKVRHISISFKDI